MPSSAADRDPLSGGVPGDASELFSDGCDTVFSGETPPGRINRGLRLTLLRVLGSAPLRVLGRRRRDSAGPVRPPALGTVASMLGDLGVRCAVLSDRVTVAWPSVRGEFLIIRDNGGLHLVFRGRLRGRTGVEQLPVLQDALALGGERSLAVCFYPAVAADATLSVRFHTAVCVDAGITDDQLHVFLERALVLVLSGCLTLIAELPALAGPRVDHPELLRADAVEATQPVEGMVVPPVPVTSDDVSPDVPEPLDMYRLRLILERLRADVQPHPRFRALALTVDGVDVHVTVDGSGTAPTGDLIVMSRWEVPTTRTATDVFGEAALACAAFDRRCPTVNVRAALVEGASGAGGERVVVCAVVLFPVSPGASDAQLVAALDCGITGVVEAVTVVREVLTGCG
ncbi:hypothetical protein [Corynebacterium pygosceleis]|uniref:hypothetical protein n=1 Tax=Corynebacterium pygosceleis TaxID=2800406 RepID=UPI001908F080|nr:hypothetical protein [Corynebacterium pygosceleis]MCK7674173.1 hypothetical protein [Corynebacterium pygosceleis]MCL0120525.1 hypothetical protein [Corynebacterium pygosceleis]